MAKRVNGIARANENPNIPVTGPVKPGCANTFHLLPALFQEKANGERYHGEYARRKQGNKPEEKSLPEYIRQTAGGIIIFYCRMVMETDLKILIILNTSNRACVIA